LGRVGLVLVEQEVDAGLAHPGLQVVQVGVVLLQGFVKLIRALWREEVQSKGGVVGVNPLNEEGGDSHCCERVGYRLGKTKSHF
jgi:hypothetical protein